MRTVKIPIAAWGFLLAVSCAAAKAEWTQAYAGDGYTSYFDAATIHRDGDLATLAQLHDLKSPGTLLDRPFRSQRAQLEYDCKDARVRMRAMALYAGPMGTGEMIESDDSVGEWKAVAADSMNHEFLKIACGKKPGR